MGAKRPGLKMEAKRPWGSDKVENVLGAKRLATPPLGVCSFHATYGEFKRTVFYLHPFPPLTPVFPKFGISLMVKKA